MACEAESTMESIEWPQITCTTPIEEVQRIHKLIWNYAITHDVKPKTPYHLNCACCEYTLQFHDGLVKCSRCPAIWDSTPYPHCMNKTSPFSQWREHEHFRKQFAILVRDIPFRKEANNG